MVARLLRTKFGLDGMDEALRLFRESVLPGCKAQKGFAKAYFLDDRETGECLIITLWESEKDMLASEENRFFQEQIAKFLPFFKAAPIRESYEVAVDESKI